MNNWNNCDCFQKSKETTTDLHQSMYYLLFMKIIVKVDWKKCLIRCDWILSIRRISEKVPDSVGFGLAFGIRHIPSDDTCRCSRSVSHVSLCVIACSNDTLPHTTGYINCVYIVNFELPVVGIRVKLYLITSFNYRLIFDEHVLINLSIKNIFAKDVWGLDAMTILVLCEQQIRSDN